MGKYAGDAFESNPSVLESYNKIADSKRRFAPEFEQFGIVLLGTWRGIPLYVSEEQYEHTDGTMKYFVPAEGSSGRGHGRSGIMAYAGIAQVAEEGKGMEVYAGRESRWSIGTRAAKIIEG